MCAACYLAVCKKSALYSDKQSCNNWFYTTPHSLSLYSKMTMEVILSTAFGRSVDVQGGNGGEVYEAAKGLFASIGESSGKYIRYLQFIICKDFVIKYRGA